MAPAGVCSSTVMMPPMLSATPTRPGDHPAPARYAARNGPRPVCTSARKKLVASRAWTVFFFLAAMAGFDSIVHLEDPNVRQTLSRPPVEGSSDNLLVAL